MAELRVDVDYQGGEECFALKMMNNSLRFKIWEGTSLVSCIRTSLINIANVAFPSAIQWSFPRSKSVGSAGGQGSRGYHITIQLAIDLGNKLLKPRRNLDVAQEPSRCKLSGITVGFDLALSSQLITYSRTKCHCCEREHEAACARPSI